MALVLYTGTSPALAETRRLLLEHAGHAVVIGLDDSEIADACRSHKFDVAVISHIGDVKTKTERLAVIRKTCPSARVLELFRQRSLPVLKEADASLEIGHPDDFLSAIAALAPRK